MRESNENVLVLSEAEVCCWSQPPAMQLALFLDVLFPPHPESSCCHGAALLFPWQQGTGMQHLHSFMAQNLPNLHCACGGVCFLIAEHQPFFRGGLRSAFVLHDAWISIIVIDRQRCIAGTKQAIFHGRVSHVHHRNKHVCCVSRRLEAL